MNIFTWFHKLQGKKDRKYFPKQIKQEGEKPIIGIVVTTFDKGGLEQVVLNLYLGYKKQGYQVYMLCQENILGIMAQQVEEGELVVFQSDLETFLNFLYEKNITLLHYLITIVENKYPKVLNLSEELRDIPQAAKVK